MISKLVPIGNSFGVRLPKALINRFDLDKKVFEILVKKEGLLIKPLSEKPIVPPIEEWDALFASAIKNGESPEGDIFNGMQNQLDKTEWTW